MDTIRYAVIGLGFFGEKHAEVLSEMPEIELVAVCTRRPHRLEDVARRFGAPKTYTDYKKLLADNEVDAVSIVTHVNDHRDIAIDAQMEVIGTRGAIYIDCGNAGLTINDTQGVHKPDTFYWPKILGKRLGILRNELSYFAECISQGKAPDVITPEQSRAAVMVMCTAERSADTSEVVKL
ncbi:Gfo/Idh/MocA family protein [Candidatus Poribacteria bacterium]